MARTAPDMSHARLRPKALARLAAFCARYRYHLCAGVAVGVLLGAVSVWQGMYYAVATARIEVEAVPLAYSVSGNINDDLATEEAFLRSWPVLAQAAHILSSTKEDDAVNARSLQSRLRIEHVADTHFLDIFVRGKTNTDAIATAEAVLKAYLAQKESDQNARSKRIAARVDAQRAVLTARLADAQNELNQFLSQHPVLMNGQDGPLEGEAHAAALDAVRRDLAAYDARIALARDQLKDKRAQNFGSLLTENQMIARLEDAESSAQLALIDLEKRYGPKHPELQAVRARLADVRTRIRDEVARGITMLEAQRTQAQTHLKTLLTGQAGDATGQPVDQSLMQTLEAYKDNVVQTRAFLNAFDAQAQNMFLRDQMATAYARVMNAPTSDIPRALRESAYILGLGAGFGLLCAFLLIILRTSMRQGIVSAPQLEHVSGYPVYALVPEVARTQNVSATMMKDPSAMLAESMRTLRVSLRLRARSGSGPRVLAFTSTVPDEGKTSLAVMLGMIAAKSGERVVIVDCDLRRPSLHRAFGVGDARGLADVLSDRLSLDDVIYKRDTSGVHIITGKAVPSYSLTLLTSGRMERVIDSLREQYDLVLLDAPSSLAFADARVLARMVDQTLYVVAANRTRRLSVLTSLKHYADMGYDTLALVLNKVPVSEYVRDDATIALMQYQEGLDKDMEKRT